MTRPQAQPDLFATPLPAWEVDGETERLGWERRALADLAQGPLVYCWPGFMGSVCQRLVAKGLARREAAGWLEGLSEYPMVRFERVA